jgi:hypothetical protein
MMEAYHDQNSLACHHAGPVGAIADQLCGNVIGGHGQLRLKRPHDNAHKPVSVGSALHLQRRNEVGFAAAASHEVDMDTQQLLATVVSDLVHADGDVGCLRVKVSREARKVSVQLHQSVAHIVM